MRKLIFTATFSGLALLVAQAQPILTETGLFDDFSTESTYIADAAKDPNDSHALPLIDGQLAISNFRVGK